MDMFKKCFGTETFLEFLKKIWFIKEKVKTISLVYFVKKKENWRHFIERRLLKSNFKILFEA